MIGPNQHRQLRPLQPMPPLLQGEFNGQQFLVPNIIILLCRPQATGEKGTGMKLAVLALTLGEHRSHPSVRSIHLQGELRRKASEPPSYSPPADEATTYTCQHSGLQLQRLLGVREH
ncbi:hypothetical protein AMECASPLE_013143 [Ameca splendens]|uniref:Uncharacterized protein n=1 Tax=Ameca splendens TaxID=208324 RepID=A0ABV0YZU2_9TELE